MSELAHSQLTFLTVKFREIDYQYDAERLWRYLDELPNSTYRYWLKLCYEKDLETLKKEVEEWLAGQEQKASA